MSVSLVRSADVNAAMQRQLSSVVELKQLLDARQRLRELHVLQEGHFRHHKWSVPRLCSTRWFDVHPLWMNSFASSSILQSIADQIPRDIKDDADVVAGPPTGGYAMARDLARYISSSRELGRPNLDSFPIDKAADGYQLRPYFRKRIKHRRVILTDDVRWDGDTFNACCSEIIGAEAHLIAVVFIIDCCAAMRQKESTLPIFALQFEDQGMVYKQSECPKCLAGEPYTQL